MTYFPKWFVKDGVRKLFQQQPTEVGWESAGGYYDFALGIWVDEPVAAEGKEELAGLRAEYKKVHGKKPFGGWSADEIRERL